jgi:hypothetical protein
MPEVHLPHLEEEHEEERPGNAQQHSRKSHLLKIGLEVILISTGVFLGLAGEQWRESSHRHELAIISLRNFRAEIQKNRIEVAKVMDYHASTGKAIGEYLANPVEKRTKARPAITGLRVVTFEHSSWDLALATQSLANIDSSLALDLSHIYTVQRQLADETQGMVQAMFLQVSNQNPDALGEAVGIYFSDMGAFEPKLVKMYDDILPRLDGALGEKK